jgi:hypothetical protein
MFTNDIIGSSLGENGVRDPHVRLFAEGVPTDETPQQAATGAVDRRRERLPVAPARALRQGGRRERATDMRVRLIYRRDRYLRGGDHIPFLEQGYPAARFTEPNENYNHQHQDVRVENGVQFGDLPQFVDFRYIARVAGSTARRWPPRQRAGARPKNAASHGQLTNDTTLKWDANPEPDLAGYEIVWRDTTEPLLDARSRSATSPPTPPRASTRTTYSSACAPSTATATAARSPSHEPDRKAPSHQ